MRTGSKNPIETALRAASLQALIVAIGVGTLTPSPANAQNFPVSPTLPTQARQFDFWVGTWDVNLRMRQDDGSWIDGVQSTAEVYPILSGKAVLELWSDDRADGIKGYSLRYFDTARDEWVLWLNWPGRNRSGSSSLSGTFRHGRGEFFSTSPNAEGGETISRYSFSDVSETSLRWDDAFSSDGGRTWTHNWIMEFSRTAAKPVLNPEGGPALTFHEGARCDAPEFRTYEFLAGRNEGETEAGGSGAVTITGHQVLDGCAILTFAGPDSDPERAWGFSHITWNTFANRYELTTLNSVASTPARMFYSGAPPTGSPAEGEPAPGTQARMIFYEATDQDGPVDRFRIEHTADGSIVWAHETPEGDAWRPVWRGRVRPSATRRPDAP